MPIRITIPALIALLVAGCPASKRDVYKAQTSGYNTDFAIVYSNALAAVTELYPHLAENPSAGVIKTAWHQIRIRQTDDGSSQRGVIGNPAAIDFDPDRGGGAVGSGGALEDQNRYHPGGTLYFVRFNVYVLGGRPWRVRIEGEAGEWEAGMKPSRLKGAERPAWLKGRAEALQVAIYRRLKKHAVPLESVESRHDRPAMKREKLDPSRYGPIPEPAAERVHALRGALRVGDFDAARGFLIDEFVWSAGGAPSADQAIIMWQADPTLASRLVAALEAGCALGDDRVITCPAEPAPGAARATFAEVGKTWMLTSFVAE